MRFKKKICLGDKRNSMRTAGWTDRI